MLENRKKIGLVGYFGWGNFGDELFLEVHRQHLEGDYDLFVANDLLEEPYFSRPVADLADESDAFIIGGGDLINPLRVSGLYWDMDFLAKPVFIFGIGVPKQPFERVKVLDHYRRFTRHPNCKLVVARDQESYDWLKKNLELGDKLQWYPDPVCTLRKPAPAQIKAGEKVLGVTMREHRSLSEDMSPLRNMIDTAKGMGYSIKHIVLANQSLGKADLGRAKLIAQGDEEIVYTEDLHEMCREISSCSMLASIKFHGMVVATMYGIPTIAMSVTPKNRNFLRMIEREEMLASYTSDSLFERVSYHPARIHNRVRYHLRSQAEKGYDLLARELKASL